MENVKLWGGLALSYCLIGLFAFGILRSPLDEIRMWAYNLVIVGWTFLILTNLLLLTKGKIRAGATPLAGAFVGMWLLAILFLVVLYSYQYRYFGLVDLNHLDPTSARAVANDAASPWLTHDPFTCIYFAVVTWTTVGYGDFVPANGTVRLLAICEAMTAYVIMGVFIAALINLLRPARLSPSPT